MHKAQFYTSKAGKQVICNLCPHRCKIEDGEYGKCNVRINKSGVLYSENYGKATGLHADPIEKKPLYHFNPGCRIMSLGTFGCNLKCDFCQNHHMSQSTIQDYPFAKNVGIESIVDILDYNKNCCGIAYTYNEPIVWHEYMTDIAEKIKDKGYANVAVTNGYINPKPLEKLLEVIDGFNIDLKAFDDEFYKKYTGATIEPVKNTLKTIAKSNAHLEATNLVIPGLNDNINTFTEMISWIEGELGVDTPLHITRYFPCYKTRIEPTPVKTILELSEIASNKLNFVYCGNISSNNGGSDTICPACNKLVIKRAGYSTFADGINEKGCCVNCKYKIAVYQ